MAPNNHIGSPSTEIEIGLELELSTRERISWAIDSWRHAIASFLDGLADRVRPGEE